MEPHNNLMLIFFSLLLITSFNVARSQVSPDISPTSQPSSSSELPSPVPSPSSSGEEEPIISFETFLPTTSDQIETATISLNSEEPSEYIKPITSDFSAMLHSVVADPDLKKICGSTDYPSLCMATALPNLKGKADIDSVLEASIKASNEFAKQALKTAKQYAEKSGMDKELSSVLKDCKDSYETAVDNFEKALGAYPGHDIGTMRSMMSAIITFIGDCEDEFKEMKKESPFSGYAEKLTNMTSNCLAIVSLMN